MGGETGGLSRLGRVGLSVLFGPAYRIRTCSLKDRSSLSTKPPFLLKSFLLLCISVVSIAMRVSCPNTELSLKSMRLRVNAMFWHC